MLKILSALVFVQLLLGCRAAAAPGAPDELLEATNRPPLGLIVSGASSWTIVVPDECTPLEREAASQLAAFLAEATGATLPVRREAEAPDANRILVGDTRAGLALAASLGVDRGALGEDGFAIRAVDQDLLLVSGLPEDGPTEPLGIVYATSHLLETQCGVRFWAPGALYVPRTDTLTLPADLSITQSPPIWFRQVNYGPANDPAYRRWHKLDRVQEEIGRLWAPRWVHSFFHHVNPDQHFKKHPEYFSLVGDRRTPSQLCLTNPEVLELVTRSFERTFEAYPDVRYISFSQEDNYGACACDSCGAIDDREETRMGSLLTFVNALAERFPERTISTLAYQYSRKPPRTLRPRENVSIMLCTIEEDRARPIATNPQSDFPTDLAGWSAITDDIFLWDYEVQFASPVAPFPNLRTLSANVRWFADAGVRHLFLQGNGLRTEFAELRCYLLAKLAWDPDSNIEALIDEFLAGYYGAAAPHLRAYLDLVHEELLASGEQLVLYGNPALAMDSWLRPEVLADARAHFDAAEAEVRDHPMHAERVRTARLPLMYAELEIAKRRGASPGGIWESHARAPEGDVETWLQPRAEVRELLEAFLVGCEAAGINRLREYDLTLETYHADWDRLLDPALPNHLALGASIEASPPASPKYAGGDVRHLVDGLPGARPGSAPVSRAYGENWVGWEGTDAVITLSLQDLKRVPTRLSFHALQEPKSWIWLPRSITVEGRGPNLVWHRITTLTHDVDEHANLAHHFEVDLADTGSLTGLRLTVDALETCPSWHLGATGPSWFFLDELRIE
ncbi:MAG: DUF4838 domain-containing protein [Planctomycetota bacterium]|jgi:hypothetical protein